MKRIIILTMALALLLGCAAEAAAVSGSGNAATATTASDEGEKDKKESRYVKMFNDNYFNYYMDNKSIKWILCPNRSNEYIIDVWVKLERIEDAYDKSMAERSDDDQYAYQEKYYLEHYYVRPSTDQIQFLCELEVSGRPDNDIRQRDYDIKNWEYLVPDSVEDNIYQAVIKKMGRKYKGKGGAFSLSNIGNTIEDVFRISI